MSLMSRYNKEGKKKGLEDSGIEEQIIKKVGKKVYFKYPTPEPHFQGVLKDRCVMSSPSWTGVPSWDVVDLIQFEEPQIFEALRFGYYRKPKSNLVWASQTTLTEPIDTFKRLFVKAAKEKKWFKGFLKDVLREAKLT